MQNDYLSWTQKNKISNQKDVYLILRSIMFLKICRGLDRIDQETFKDEVAKLKKKYILFTSMIPNFHIDTFCKDFNIPRQEINGALPQVEEKIEDQGQKLSGQLLMKITALSIQVNDLGSLNVEEVRPPLENILTMMNSICAEFRNDELNEKVEKLKKSTEKFIGSRNIDEDLSEVEMKELKLQVSALFNFLFMLSGKAALKKTN